METLIVIVIISMALAGAAYMAWDIQKMWDAGVEVPDIPYTHPISAIPFLLGAIPMAIMAPEILAYAVLAHLAYWIFDKILFSYVDRALEQSHQSPTKPKPLSSDVAQFGMSDKLH